MKIHYIFIFLVLLSVPVFAHETKSPDEIISNIMIKQNASKINEINCNKISDNEFEEIGDAIMEKMMSSFHARAHEVMGGEKSTMSVNMHITMGKNWLNCSDNQNMMGMMSMMIPQYSDYIFIAQVALSISIISIVSVVVVGFVLLNKLNSIEKRIKKR